MGVTMSYRSYGTKNEPKNYTTKNRFLKPLDLNFVPQNKVTKIFKTTSQNCFWGKKWKPYEKRALEACRVFTDVGGGDGGSRLSVVAHVL